MIRLDQVEICIPDRTLLSGVTLRIAAGDKLVLQGASGSGKSTLLKCIAGLMPIAAGTIEVDGIRLEAAQLDRIRSRIAFIGQEPVMGAGTVSDALLLPFTFKAHQSSRPGSRRVAEILARMQLPESILEQPTGRISGGEKQRIAIARALLIGKQIFLADEVTSALDPESKAAVMQELQRPDITLLSVSHDPDWVAGCSRVAAIRDAAVVEGVPAPKGGAV